MKLIIDIPDEEASKMVEDFEENIMEAKFFLAKSIIQFCVTNEIAINGIVME